MNHSQVVPPLGGLGARDRLKPGLPILYFSSPFIGG